MDKLKILWFGDAACVTTGFGKVAAGILDGLYKTGKYEIIQLGSNYYGDPHNKPYDIYPLRVGDPYGKNRLYEVMKGVSPDIFISNNDIWAMGWITSVISAARQETGKIIPWIAYFPIDGLPIKPEWTNFIRNYIDIPITYTKWAVDNIKKVDETLDLDYVYHGVDTSTYSPDEDIKLQMRTQISKSLEKDINFVVGYVGRNQPRKRLPELMMAFRTFAENKSDVLLYLHTPIIDMGWNIKKVKDTLQIPDDTILTTPKLSPAVGIEEYRLANIYRLFDVICLPTVGEGFGLPLIEGMATGCPVVSTNCSVIPEIVGDAGILVKPGSMQIMPNDNELIRPLPSISEMAEAFEFLYSNKEARKEMSEKATERAKTFSSWRIPF